MREIFSTKSFCVNLLEYFIKSGNSIFILSYLRFTDLFVDPDDADAGVRGMLAEILPKCHRFLNHLLVKLRGVQQMQVAILPNGESQMGDVEAGLLAGDGDNVAVANSLVHLSTTAYSRLRDIAELLARHALLHPLYLAHVFRVLAQSLIALGVLAHIVDTDGLNGCEWRIGRLDLCDEARLCVLRNPLREVMDARRVAVYPPLPIAHSRERIQVSLPRVLLAIGTLRKGSDGLNERGAIQLPRVHHQALLPFPLEGVGHVGDAYEFPGKEEGHVRAGRLLPRLAEQAADGDAVGLLVDRAQSCCLGGDRGR